jgi:TolA-binding protein
MIRPLVLAAAVFGTILVSANTPDRQFAFAEHLMEQGDEAFALLEYKRFLFESPKHSSAPDAMYAIAQIQLSYVQNVDAAKKTLREIVAKYPKTKTAQRARAFADYIEVNSDFGAKPLLGMLAARADEKAGKYDRAAAAYQRIVSDFPRARLAPAAARDLAVVQLRNLKQPAAARNALNWLIQSHPKSELVPEARLLLVEANEAEQGPSAAIAAQYRDVAKRYPKTEVAKQALEKAKDVERQAFAVKRQFSKDFVRKYVVKQQGYRSSNRQLYVCEIEIPKDCSEREVKATLEDALIAEGAKRSTVGHGVAVTGFFSYPLTEAGKVTWQPGNAPDYKIPERKGEDVLKDVFIDLLRRR